MYCCDTAEDFDREHILILDHNKAHLNFNDSRCEWNMAIANKNISWLVLKRTHYWQFLSMC